MNAVWNLYGVAQHFYVLDVLPSLLDCVMSANYYFEATGVLLFCAKAVAA